MFSQMAFAEIAPIDGPVFVEREMPRDTALLSMLVGVLIHDHLDVFLFGFGDNFHVASVSTRGHKLSRQFEHYPKLMSPVIITRHRHFKRMIECPFPSSRSRQAIKSVQTEREVVSFNKFDLASARLSFAHRIGGYEEDNFRP